MESVWRKYNEILDTADPRVKHLPLADSPGPVFGILLVYLLFVFFGPRIMQHRNPFQLKWILIVYNVCMVTYSFSLVVYGLYKIYQRGGVSMTCEELDRGENQETKILVIVGWSIFFSKVVETTDTVFLILRKKKLTFLHVYHHSAAIVVFWMGYKWLPGGQTWFPVFVNLCVHSVMYTYYGLSALGPHMRKYLWWKKYITTMQLMQFVMVMIHCAVNYFADCAFPKIFDVLNIFFVLSQFVLFFNFYIQTYTDEKKRE